jgi:UDP-glucose 4-epimerase
MPSPRDTVASRPQRVLITGVAGMLGSHLLDRLMEDGGYEVVGIDDLSFGKLENIAHHRGDGRFRFYRVSILDLETLKILGRDTDVFVHLAAVKKIGEAEAAMPTLSVNVKGTENVFEVARMWGGKVILASTSDVYGMSPDLPYREDGDLLLGPSMIKRWSYAVSKLYCEQLAYAYYHDGGVPMVCLRYFGGFSPRSSFKWSGGHVPIFINAILNDEEVTVHGDGCQTRSMGFVTDIVEGTYLAMRSGKALGEIINIGNTEEMSVLSCAKLIHRLAGTEKELKIRFVPMQEVFGKYKDIMRRQPDLTKAEALLGYMPKVSMEEGIRRTIAEVRKRNG